MNFYAILGIPADADDEAIRIAYKTLARRYHPDAGLGSSAEKFRQVSEAYDTLRDAGRRQMYDRSLHPSHAPMRFPVEPIGARAEPLAGTSYFSPDSIFDELIRLLEDAARFGGPRRR